MKVKFTSLQIQSRTIKAKATGKEYTFREQEALVSFPNGEVRKIAVSLEHDQAAYSLGEWLLGDGSFMVDRFNRLTLGRLSLSPVQSQVLGVKTA